MVIRTSINLKGLSTLKKYEEITPSKRNNWCWVTSYQLPIAKFRNELIGTLCVELSQGEDLNSACLNWNKTS